MMIDVKRPARPVIDALKQRGVQVGRPFPTNRRLATMQLEQAADPRTYCFKERRHQWQLAIAPGN